MGGYGNHPINESMKKWSPGVTEEKYDLAVLTPREFCRKWKITRKQYEERYGSTE